MTVKKSRKLIDHNEELLKDASDTLLFLSDSFLENKHKMHSMEFANHIEKASQDVVYNLTQIVRNLAIEMDKLDE